MTHNQLVTSRHGSDRETAAAGTLAVSIHDDLARLPERFEKLFEKAGEGSIHHTRSWYENYIRTVIGPGDSLRVYAVESQAGAPKGLLLMRHARQTSPLGPARLEGLANYYSSLFGPIVDADDPDLPRTIDSMARAIAGDTIRWGIVDLHPLALDDVVFPELVKALRSAGFLVHRYFCFGNWYLKVAGKAFSQYFAERPSRLANTVKRKRRKLEAGNRLRYQLYTEPEGLERGIADYNKVYASSWKVPEPYPDFVGGLMRTCARNGSLRLGVAYVDGEPAAAQFWIHSGSTTSIFKLAYDERYANDSVGTILSTLLMEHAIDVDKATVIDYLSGDDAHKQEWMSDRRERWGVIAFNPLTVHGLCAAGQHVASLFAWRTLDFFRRWRRGRS
jgi:hypothetical protein